ncbi:MAG: septum formation initiator family protein [Elusimicrobiota bacterium]
MRTSKSIKLKVKYLVLISLGLVFSAGGIYNLIKNYYQVYKLSSYKKKLLKENQKLKSKISMTDKTEFVEYNARIRLGLKKSDEIEYRFNPPKDK